jgi:hypothetical protein
MHMNVGLCYTDWLESHLVPNCMRGSFPVSFSFGFAVSEVAQLCWSGGKGMEDETSTLSLSARQCG